MVKRYLAAFALLAALLVGSAGFAGCSSSTQDDAAGGPEATPVAAGEATPAPAASAVHLGDDGMFLQMMIVHIKQGRELAALAATNSARDDVRNLASAVDSTQGEEAKVMTAWLQGWSEPTETAHDPNMHANHGGLPALGEAQLAELKQAAGADFDRKFLNLLIGHQHNAVELTKLADSGTNPETKDLARRIKESRSDQISLMLTMASA
ncbi:DUF305 domain-containing protein [Virgisporangium ochraceum]